MCFRHAAVAISHQKRLAVFSRLKDDPPPPEGGGGGGCVGPLKRIFVDRKYKSRGARPRHVREYKQHLGFEALFLLLLRNEFLLLFVVGIREARLRRRRAEAGQAERGVLCAANLNSRGGPKPRTGAAGISLQQMWDAQNAQTDYSSTPDLSTGEFSPRKTMDLMSETHLMGHFD